MCPQHLRVNSAAAGGNAPWTTFLPRVSRNSTTGTDIGVPFAVGAIDIHSLIDKLRLLLHHSQSRLRKAVSEHLPIGLKPLLSGQGVEGKLEVPEIDEHLYPHTVFDGGLCHLALRKNCGGAKAPPGCYRSGALMPRMSRGNA